MNLYDQLAVIEPLLAGPWRWAWYALVAAPLALACWAMVGRRWRPDGVRRCVRCGHPFDPAARFGAEVAPRCAECGTHTASESAALRRRGRRPLFILGIALALALALPLALWHSAHVFVARTVLPRWVVSQRAEFPDGLVLVEEVDPVQAWLGFEPNPAPDAWHGRFEDESPPLAGQPGPGALTWPDRARIRAFLREGGLQASSGLGPFRFGASATERMPAVGAPGFGGDLDGDGVPDVVVGEVNIGSGGGISWLQVRRTKATAASAGGAEFEPLGFGMFAADSRHADWVFRKVCHGFRYAVTPGAYSGDPAITCTFDGLRGWVPNANRMRRAADQELLARLASEAAARYEECTQAAAKADAADAKDPGAADSATAALRAFRNGQAGMEEFLPCPELVGTLLAGVLELFTSGNGAEWEQWARSSWPPSAAASFRDAFIADVRRALGSCECARFLRELNGLPEAGPAAEASPVPQGGGQ